jgi:hypothetical protein
MIIKMILFPFIQGGMSLIEGLLIFIAGVILMQFARESHNSILKYFSWATTLIFISFIFEVFAFWAVQIDLILASYMINVVAPFILHIALAFTLIPILLLRFRDAPSYVVGIPVVMGIIASLFAIFSLTVPEIDMNGFVTWHRNALSEFITILTTLAIAVLCGYTLISTLIKIRQRNRQSALFFVTMGIGLFALFSPLTLFTNYVLMYWVLNCLTIIGEVIILAGLIKLRMNSRGKALLETKN